MALVQLDVQWHYFLAVLGKGELQKRMYCHRPVQYLLVLKSRFQSGYLFGKQGFSTYKVYFGQEFVRQQYVGDGWTQLVGKVRQDADDLPAFVSFQFADAVVGFYYLGRLDEDGLSAGGLVVHDAFNLSFQCRGNGNHQSTIAHSGRYVFVYYAFGLGTAQDAVQRTGDASHRSGQFPADACQFVGGIIFYLPIRGEDAVYFRNELREYGDVSCQSFQARVGGGAFFIVVVSL